MWADRLATRSRICTGRLAARDGLRTDDTLRSNFTLARGAKSTSWRCPEESLISSKRFQVRTISPRVGPMTAGGCILPRSTDQSLSRFGKYRSMAARPSGLQTMAELHRRNRLTVDIFTMPSTNEVECGECLLMAAKKVKS